MGAPRYGNRVSSEKSKKRYFIVNFLLYKHNDNDIFDNFPRLVCVEVHRYKNNRDKRYFISTRNLVIFSLLYKHTDCDIL